MKILLTIRSAIFLTAEKAEIRDTGCAKEVVQISKGNSK